jgi:putative acetyltransferase
MLNSTEIYLRPYKKEDLLELVELFFNTVHNIASKDYTEKQLNAWASGNIDLNAWNHTLSENHTIIAEIDEKIVGFGDIAGDYLNRLYVHEDYQGMGIATQITNHLENYALNQGIQIIEVHASITAKPYFEHRNYKVVKEQQVVRNGESITNFVMSKMIEH